MSAAHAISRNSIVTRVDENFLVSKLGNDTVMMNMNTGEYLGINSVATEIWTKIQGTVSVSDLIDTLLAAYDVSSEQCETETIACLEKMHSHGVIQVTG